MLAIIPTVAHVAEDAVLNVPARFGLSVLTGGTIAGAALVLQVLLAFGCLQHHRGAYLGMIVVAGGWALFATLDHPGAFEAGTYRAGLGSRVAVWSMVGLEAVAALTALAVLRSTRRNQ